MKIFRMSYKAKTILSNSLFLISIFVLIFMIFSSQTVNIDFGQQELKGNKLQVELMKVLNNVVIHKHAKNPKEIETQIIENLKLVNQVMKEYGEDLQFTEDGLKKRGREAFDYSGLESLIKDLLETKKITHRNVINHILTMITHAGDTSNLILDPDLDSYYLMDVTLLAVPLFIDKSAYIFDDLIENAGKDVTAKKTEYAVYSSRLTDDFNRMSASLKTAINEDPNFYGKSEKLSKLSEEITRVEAEFKKTSDLLNQTTLPDREKIIAQKENLNMLIFSFWSQSEKELTKLLETRVQKLQNERLLDIGIALIVALVGIVFTVIVNFRASDELREYLEEFKAIINNANDVSSNVNETFNSLSSAAREQASAVQETASTLEEINQTVAKNSDNANSTSKLFSESYDKVNQGKKTLELVLKSMTQISEANEKLLTEFDENSKRIEEIAQSIQEISNKTQIINDIVFQTKLLSFNASVEAARAGEMGKGFAVVAEEVGNLAQMSGNASKDIGDMVLKSIESANKIAEKTRDNASKKVDEFKTKIQKGIRTTEECNEIFQVIVENIGQLNGLLEEFRISAKEQSSGVSNITSAMENIDQTLNTNNKELTHSVQGITELQLKLADVSKELKRLERYIWGV